MRAVRQRLIEQKKPTIRKKKGLRDINGKIQIDAKNKLRIATEYIQKRIPQKMKPKKNEP